jgi:hypothetical protein
LRIFVRTMARPFDESIARYIAQLETADRRGDAVPGARIVRFKNKS